MGDSILEVMHETAKGLYKSGLMDIKTMREFDKLCLPEVKEYSPEQIKKIRFFSVRFWLIKPLQYYVFRFYVSGSLNQKCNKIW